jgi:hypothetical protein
MIVVGEAADGQERLSGLDALIAIKQERLDARIIVLTPYAGDVQILSRCGAATPRCSTGAPCCRN